MAKPPRKMTEKELYRLVQSEYPPADGETISKNIFPKELLEDQFQEDEQGLIIDPSTPNHQIIYHLAVELDHTDNPPYQPLATKYSKQGGMQCMMPRLIKALNHLANTRSKWCHAYCPRVALFLETFDSLLSGIDRFDQPSRLHARPHPNGEADPEQFINRTTSDLVTEFTQRMRMTMRTKDYQRKEANWRGRANYRIKSAETYINNLFETYSRLLVIRVDLYPEKFKANDLVRTSETGPPTTTDHLKNLTSNVERLMNNRRNNQLFEHCVGHIFKIEYAPERGWHAHTIFFYDGHKVQNDSHYSIEIGKYWQDRITDGKGTYWACNRPSNLLNYPRIGIGMIDHTNSEKRQALIEVVVTYLAKTDNFIQCKTFQGQKLFRTGQPPKARAIKRGRPRLLTKNPDHT